LLEVTVSAVDRVSGFTLVPWIRIF